MYIVKMDALLIRKNPKCHFYRGIENSFHEATQIGLEPHHFFFFLKYLNKYGGKKHPKFWPKWAVVGRLFEIWPNLFFSNLHRHVMNKC